MSHNKRAWFILTACGLLFLGLDFPKFKTGEERAFTDFQSALMHYNAREYSLSREKLLNVIAQKRDFPLAKLYLSRSLYQSGEWLDSLQVMEELNRNHSETAISSRLEYLQMEIARQKLPLGEMVFFKSLNGDEKRGYRFRNPVDVSVDEKGTIYILSFGTGNLVSLHPNYEPKWMAQGGFARKMKGPLSMVLWEDKIFVADFPSDHIYLFNTKGQYIDRFGGSGSELNQFRGPSSITRDQEGNFYIADTGNHRILKWNSKLEPLFAFGTSGKGKLSIPSGIQYYEGKLYALDKVDARIIVYDEEGNFIRDYKSNYLKKPRHIRFLKDTMIVSDEISGIVYMDLKTLEWNKNKPFQDKSGKIRNVDRPFSSFQDDFGYLYLTDYNRNRIDIFSPQSYILSNLILDIEKIDTSDFPNIHVLFQLKNRRGKSLPGLKRKDFNFIENQNEKKFFDLTDMKKYNRKITASMVFENSETLIRENNKLNSWLDNFFSKLTYDDRIEIIRSGFSATKILNYSVSKNEIFFAMRNSKPETNINSGKAIYQAISNLSKELGPRAVIYLASGKEPLYTKQFSLQKITQFAKANGIQIYPVVIHKNSEDDTWQSLAEESGGEVFYLNDSSEKLFKSIQSNLDNRYVLSYKTEVKETITDRWIPLKLNVSFRNFGGTTTGGYFVPKK